MFWKKKKRKIIGIEGMKSEECEKKIDKVLTELQDVEYAKVNQRKKCAIVYYEEEVDSILLQKTIEELGYTVTGIKEVR